MRGKKKTRLIACRLSRTGSCACQAEDSLCVEHLLNTCLEIQSRVASFVVVFFLSWPVETKISLYSQTKPTLQPHQACPKAPDGDDRLRRGVPSSFIWCPWGGMAVSCHSPLWASPCLLRGALRRTGALGVLCPHLLVLPWCGCPSARAAQRGTGEASTGGGVRGLT